MRVLVHADEVRSPEERERIAKLAAHGDKAQEQITAAALAEAGGKYVTVRRRRKGEAAEWRKVNRRMPKWVGCFAGEEDSDSVLTFVGVPYGGDTKREAMEDVKRLASKWGWGVIEA